MSAKLGLLGDLHSLGVCGDGTPLETARYPRSKSTCDCSAQGITNCNHPRLYSQPDCNSGWDSSRERYFNGYHLYMISTSDSFTIYLYILDCSPLHDTMLSALLLVPLNFHNDSPWAQLIEYFLTLHMMRKQFISCYSTITSSLLSILTLEQKKNYSSEGDIKISSKGIPICPIGKEMKPNGYDISQNRQKWRCPLACGTKNPCKSPCSNAKYGRTFPYFFLRIIYGCSPKPLDLQKSGSLFTNGVLLLNVLINGKKLIIT